MTLGDVGLISILLFLVVLVSAAIYRLAEFIGDVLFRHKRK